MYQILLIGHGELAVELLRSAEMILGVQPEGAAAALVLRQGQNLAQYAQELERRVCRAKAAGGCLVLADVAGGSPFITAAQAYRKLADQCPMEIVTGMNLPMLIELLNIRETASLEQGKDTALQEGIQGIISFSAQLTNRQG